MDCLRGEALADLLGGVCGEHARVIPTESYTALPTPDERLRAVTALQQKAESLEAEVAQRKEAEERLRSALFAERAARHEAQSALRQRDEFLSIAAHELKTPVTSLSGHTQLALRKLTRGGPIGPRARHQSAGNRQRPGGKADASDEPIVRRFAG